jgi:hypothetical protein
LTDQPIIGVSAYPTADDSLLKQAGIGWVRAHFGYVFTDGPGSAMSERYRELEAAARKWRDRGFRVMGTTPLIGRGVRETGADGKLQFVWHDQFPDWMGPLGSDEFCRNYEEVCAFQAADLKDIADTWQVANELDIPIFGGPLNPNEACDLIEAGARGLKRGNPRSRAGHNIAGGEQDIYFLGRFAACDAIDYTGVDGYYGTWSDGGPRSWSDRIEQLYTLTGKPVLVNEWGYASYGEVMDEQQFATGAWPCQFKRWRFGWDAGHTPQVQAKFVADAFDAFCEHRDKLMGAFFYRWEDQEKCWQCGQPDCPSEIAWGLVDRDGKPKPSFDAFAAGAAKLRG